MLKCSQKTLSTDVSVSPLSHLHTLFQMAQRHRMSVPFPTLPYLQLGYNFLTPTRSCKHEHSLMFRLPPQHIPESKITHSQRLHSLILLTSSKTSHLQRSHPYHVQLEDFGMKIRIFSVNSGNNESCESQNGALSHPNPVLWNMLRSWDVMFVMGSGVHIMATSDHTDRP